MRGSKDAALQALRLKYNAALAAHQGCMRALTEAALGGTTPSAVSLETEVSARAELERARTALLAAITEAITGRPAGAGDAPLQSPAPQREL